MSYSLNDLEKWAGESDYAKLNRYFQNHPDKALAALSETKDTVKWAGTSAKHLYKKHQAGQKSRRVEEEAKLQWSDPAGRAAITAELKADHKEAAARERKMNQRMKAFEKMTPEEVEMESDFDEMKEWKYRQARKLEKTAGWAFGKNRYIPRTLDDDTLRERMRFATHTGDVLIRGIERFEDLDPEENRSLFEKNLRLKRAEQAARVSKERRQAINILSGMAAVPPTLIGLAGVYEGQRAGNRELARKGAAIAATSSALPLGIAAYRFKKKHYDSQKAEAIAKDQEERRKDSDAAVDYFRMERLVDAYQRSKKEKGR